MKKSFVIALSLTSLPRFAKCPGLCDSSPPPRSSLSCKCMSFLCYTYNSKELIMSCTTCPAISLPGRYLPNLTPSLFPFWLSPLFQNRCSIPDPGVSQTSTGQRKHHEVYPSWLELLGFSCLKVWDIDKKGLAAEALLCMGLRKQNRIAEARVLEILALGQGNRE